MKTIDFRSDTVTRPSPEMRSVMANASVGDDVYGEDPTINLLETKVAKIFNKEASLFVPSGTMANQIAIGVHCRPGDEIITDPSFHVYEWECGAPAMLWGTSFRFIEGKDLSFDVEECERAIRANDVHYPRTRVLWLENTMNRKGGAIFPIEKIRALAHWSREKNIKMHLDGARLWHAHTALGLELSQYGELFDSISVCFSKGLGAPVGSVLLGSREFIEESRRKRKALGGGLRQAGILAAAANYGLENNLGKLNNTHLQAKKLAEVFASRFKNICILPFGTPETNILWVNFFDEKKATELNHYLKERGILISQRGVAIRLVTHIDVSDHQINDTINVLNNFK